MMNGIPTRFEDEFPEEAEVLMGLCQERMENKKQGNKNTPINLDTMYVPQEKVGRNSPCLCGSGKKSKKCCQ